MKHKIVIIESPYKGNISRNRIYAIQALRHSLLLGEYPIASHIMYTEALDDNIPKERAIGIQAGLKLGRMAKKTVVYADYGISSGMRLGIEDALKYGRKVEIRCIM